MSSTEPRESEATDQQGGPRSDLRQLPDGSWVRTITCHGPVPGLEAPHYARQGTYTVPVTTYLETLRIGGTIVDDFSIPV